MIFVHHMICTFAGHERISFSTEIDESKTLCFDTDYTFDIDEFSILITNIKFHYDHRNPSTRQMTTVEI